MKLPMMACSMCSAVPDSEDPNWKFHGDEVAHYCDGIDNPSSRIGLAVLRRSKAREEAIAEQAASFRDAQKLVDQDIHKARVDERRRRTLKELGR